MLKKSSVLGRCLLTLCLMLALFVAPSAAQEEEVAAKAKEMVTDTVASLEDCPGPVATWRENELAEGGSYEGFLEAIRDHHAWVVNKGYTEVRIRTWVAFEPADQPPFDQQVGFGSEAVYPDVAYWNKVFSTREKDKDDAYDAFVAKYRANTVLKTTRFLCLSE